MNIEELNDAVLVGIIKTLNIMKQVSAGMKICTSCISSSDSKKQSKRVLS